MDRDKIIFWRDKVSGRVLGVKHFHGLFMVRDFDRAVAGDERVFSEALRRQRIHACVLTEAKQRLRNPVHKRTGEPLTEGGIKGFQTQLSQARKTLYANRILIQGLIACGLHKSRPANVVDFLEWKAKRAANGDW
ncbi:hypothetical protein [Desulfatitalea alkaliphila]|uniref:Uncharacterized protein n=1 Tax=Desulfatitalea alkaliphila TaxID=2929485 RepID=A0AA41R3K7_9BACT|nr:hypothetical protein [Desulfatitalea alkaliphila]MCJ8501021.1 hypothetical protein [Desulfatitalea alkaliphila]